MTCLRIAHRGAAGYFPGNTLLAVEKALRMNVEVIEIDVRMTSDNQPVVFHDRFLQFSTDGRGLAAGCSLNELRKYHTRDGGQPVPTLVEILDKVTGRAGLMIEIKAPNSARQVAATVGESSFRGDIFYASFLHSELLEIRAVNPSAATIALLEGVPVRQTAFLSDAQATHAGLGIGVLDKSFVRAIHDAGFKVFTYTADEPEEIAYAKSCEVDGIISNFPDRL